MPAAHKHLILKGVVIPPNTAAQISRTLRELTDCIGMRPLAPANVVWCDEPGNKGFTGVQLLTTSHMIWHDWEIPGEYSQLQFDLYSCAPFDVNAVIKFLANRHDLGAAVWRLFDREYGIIDEKTYP